MTRTGKDLLPHVFKSRGVPTKHDPAAAISAIECPACKATKSWRIVSTRTLKTTRDIKRHCLCLGCGYMAVFMERDIKGVPTIALAPDDKESELLSKIDALTGELAAQAPRMKLLDQVWELFEPGSRNMTPDEIFACIIARAGGAEAGPDDAWAPVRKVLGGLLDDKTAATPDAIAEAIDQVLTKAKVDAERAQADARGYYEDKLILVRHLEAAGAKKVGESGWAWPFYKADGTVELMSVTEWMKKRKAAAVELDELRARVEELTAKAKTDKIAKPKKGGKKPAAIQGAA